MDKKLYLLVILLLPLSFITAQVVKFPNLKGEYLGRIKPGKTPELFAPGILCTGFSERDITFSPDGKEIFFGLLSSSHITIMYTKEINGKWTEPEIAPFATDDKFFYLEPCFSGDGKKVFFLTTRPPQGKEPKPRWGYQNIWAADKKDDGSWSQPYNPDTTNINTGGVQYYPSFTNDGTIYFSRVDPQTQKPSIWRSRFADGRFGPAEKLPAIVNLEGTSVYNAFISRDESYLIACVTGRKNDINPGFANYYIFFRDKDDNWSEGIIFGPEINMKGSNASSASVSPDGRYLFFAAQKIDQKFNNPSGYKTISKIIELSNSPQNGNSDIYWVDAKVIEELRLKVLK